ncbi:MAG: hypothetical protein QOD42_1424 [Sphingomonadales bacterium]|jgi:hypothetical protein|nr:hypothetical protein [Sphingomonadales bacterium]
MPKLLLALAALMVPAAAQAERFAIACEGVATLRMSQSGRSLPEELPARTRQIYVIDEGAQTVRRALLPLRLLDDHCPGQLRCFARFAPESIRVEQESVEPDLSFRSSLEVDRRSWRADYRMDVASPAMRTQSHWAMTCRRTAIPALARR